MNKKFISVFMMGAATLAPLSTLVSCSDYDDDINNLQAQIDASGVNLKEEVSKLQKVLDECKAAAEKADADLEQAIKNATNDAKGYADIQAEQAKQAAIAALQAQLSQAIADLENGAIADAKARAEQAYNLAEQTSKLANINKAELEKLAKELETVNTDLQKAIEALQTRMTAAEAAIAEVKTQAAENKAQLTTLETTLNALKASTRLPTTPSATRTTNWLPSSLPTRRKSKANWPTRYLPSTRSLARSTPPSAPSKAA